MSEVPVFIVYGGMPPSRKLAVRKARKLGKSSHTENASYGYRFEAECPLFAEAYLDELLELAQASRHTPHATCHTPTFTHSTSRPT